MIPVILGAVALGTAAVGAFSGASGAANIKQAKDIGQRAQERYERTLNQLNHQRDLVNQEAQRYGHLQQYVKLRTINGFVALIERINRRTSDQEFLFLEEFDISLAQLQTYKALALEALQFAKGSAEVVLMGNAASQSEMGLALSVRSGNTSVAVLSEPSGRNGTLAWSKGSAERIDNRQMALESLVLGEIMLGSALVVDRFCLIGQGEKALLQAKEYEDQVNTSIARLEATREYLQQVKRRIDELKHLVKNLNERVLQSLHDAECELEFQDFDAAKDAGKFLKIAELIKALAEIIRTPILDRQGQINPKVVMFQERYRNF